MSDLQQKTWEVIEPSRGHGWSGRVFSFAICGLIFLAVLSVIFESVPRYYNKHASLFKDFEYFCLIVFGIEYLIRLWASGAEEKYRGLRGKFRFIFSFMALIDLAAILPGILLLGAIDLRFLRSIRLLRLLRLGRYNRGVRLIIITFQECGKQLLVTLSGVIVLLVISSGLLYFVERNAQPEAFGSIPAAMWWAIATLTTVGYGDVVPRTIAGKLLASCIMILGIGSFAIPAGIIAANFRASMEHVQQNFCPHCGEKL